MNVSQAIESRRSVQKFDPNHEISKEEVHQLIGAALLCPSAFNAQPWRFVWVTSPEVRDHLSRAAWNQPQITEASAVILVCMEVDCWDKAPERYWSNTDEKTRAHMVKGMRGYYSNNAQAAHDDAMRAASMASMTLMLKAREMDYDTCVVAFDHNIVADAVKLPDGHELCMMLAVGRQLVEPYPRPGQLELKETLYFDTF